MKKILILLSGNILYDARVSKEIASLRKFGYSVVLVQTHKLGENKICLLYTSPSPRDA